MRFIAFIIFTQTALSDDYPSIRHPINGIFKWFNSLSHVKKGFHNSKFLGFRVNSSELDLIMIAKDIAHNLNLHDLNISGKMSDVVNNYNIRPQKTQKIIMNTTECPKEYENIYQFCRLTGINLNLENYGIPSEHVDIILSNIIGYIPCGLLLVILGFATIIFYILQIILSFYFFKPTENTSPTILQYILFYLGDLILLISIIFYCLSYNGLNSLLTTLMSLDSVVTQVTSSLSTSFQKIANVGIPNAVGPVITSMLNVCNTTQKYFNETAASFLNPTITILEKLVSKNENDPGIFTIYNSYIYQQANEFYSNAKKYPKLKNISKYFARYDFSSYQSEIQDLLNKELEFSDKLEQLNSFFDYINATLFRFQKVVLNLTSQKVAGTNKTVGEHINEFEKKNINSYYYLSELNQTVNSNSNYCRCVRIGFFVFGVILFGSVFFYAVIYLFKNKFSICIASTISIFPIIATALMFFIAFVFTEFGAFEVSLSEQLEPAVDVFLTNVVDVIIPFRMIKIPIINITYQTNNYYRGAINLSNIVFPNPMNSIEYFVHSNKKTGLADSLQLPKIADLSQYGDELGNFIIDIGQSFSLPKIVVLLIEGIEQLFRLISYFPNKIDGFFNWGIPMSLTTKHLRVEINEMDPSALSELEPFLEEIDSYIDLMNSQYRIALYEIYENLANAVDKIDVNLVNFIRSILNELGLSVKHLLKNVYPILNYIEVEPIIGPYAKVRNIVFYDLASMSAYVSVSGTLMMIGFVFIVVLMWIRRKGMGSDNSLELRRNQSNKLDDSECSIEKLAV